MARGISTLFDASCSAWGRPLDIMAALGHGRSYGQQSWVLGRSLPGIVFCGLWAHLKDRPQAPTAALITDVGNDLLYGSSVQQIIDWVGICLERLADAKASCVLTGLPVNSLRKLGAWRYRFFRTVLFPKCRLDLPTIQQRAWELNEGIIRLADESGVHVALPDATWYGLDPIHIRSQKMALAWRELMAPWNKMPEAALSQKSAGDWLYLRRLRPLERKWLGFRQSQGQPAGRLADGTQISLF